MPEFVDEVLKWAGTNKDALLALGAFLAAFLAPVTAIIAAAVSYRAVVTGPRVQMRIAQQQNELAERQQALHEKQFALTEQQLRFTIFGASQQKWISDFQEMLAHLFGLGHRAAIIHMALQASGLDHAHHDINQTKLFAIHNELNDLISRIWLHLGSADSVTDFVEILREWSIFTKEFDHNVWAQRQRDIFMTALRIISDRQAQIGFNQTASG